MLVMTFNLRFANPSDGPNEWEHRKALAAEIIRRHAPDLLATQEGTTAMLGFLEAELTEYRPLKAQRPVDETCQYPTIFYRAGRFTVHETREFWLSQTPEIHRSCSWGSAFPRMVTCGLLQEERRTETFYFINTHLDNVSQEARLRGARMILDYFMPLGRPLILAGDFNESPDDAVYQELIRGIDHELPSSRGVHQRRDDRLDVRRPRIIEHEDLGVDRLLGEALQAHDLDDRAILDISVTHRREDHREDLPPGHIVQLDGSLSLQRVRNDQVQLKKIGDVPEDRPDILVRKIDRERVAVAADPGRCRFGPLNGNARICRFRGCGGGGSGGGDGSGSSRRFLAPHEASRNRQDECD